MGLDDERWWSSFPEWVAMAASAPSAMTSSATPSPVSVIMMSPKGMCSILLVSVNDGTD